MEFSSLPLSPALLQVARELGYTRLTPIQEKSIPFLLEGRDLVGKSKTGSGKTAAFSLPILEKLNLAQKQLQAMVLCPTRELCTQVAREIRRLGCHHPGLRVLILSGGQPMYPQLTALEGGVHIVVGTPGRVLDHLNRRTLQLGSIRTLVLDEADRMLDMGFQEDIETILQTTPPTRQTVFFSATYPESIEKMSQAFQKNPAQVSIEESGQAAPQIRQVAYVAESSEKLKGLLWLLQQNAHEAAMIFCNQKTTVNELQKTLLQAGLNVGCLHGDLEQYDRDRVMAKFRNQSLRLLIATDVAARGIDVADLDIVINFDLPPQPEVYVHRIGRTGRAGKKGLAISLATPREDGRLHAIETFTGAKFQRKTLSDVQAIEVSALAEVLHRDPKMETLRILSGRKDKMRPGDILGALTGDAGGLAATEVGKIEIHDRFSYVAVSKKYSQIALQRLNDGRIKGRKIRVERVR